MFKKLDQTIPQEKQIELVSLTPSSLRAMRNVLLSFIPVDLAIKLGEILDGPFTEKKVFRLFIQEIEDGLIIKIGSSNFLGKLMPLYIMETLRHNLHTGDLLELGDQNEFDLQKAYDPELDEETQQLYKQRVFKRFMGTLGPHGLKFIQNLQAKDSNSWIAKVITTAQSSLPAPSIEEFEHKLIDAFKARNSIYGERFSEFFTVKRILGAGTVGTAALVEFRSPEGTTEEYVIKILHKDIAKAFQIDYKCLENAAETLLATEQISLSTALAFKRYNDDSFERERQELNPDREMRFLCATPYDEPGVCTTVKANLKIADEAEGIVCMEKAKGIELGKYLQKLNHKLALASSQEERDSYLDEIATLRALYAKLALFHFKRGLNNESLHCDLHPGNLFYDPESQLLSVLDLGSMAHPIEPEEHIKLQRFLFALHLSLSTADSHYLRLYYQNEMQEHNMMTMEEIESMLAIMQNELDSIKREHADKKVMNVDIAIDRVMGVIKDSILDIGVHIVPSALFTTAKANTPVNDTLDALRYILTSSSHDHAISYGERTQFAIALNASYQAGLMRKTLWTKELWDYFLHNLIHPKEGFAQLHYEKQFIYSIFGLKEEEAAMADVLIPATIVSAALVLVLIAFSLKKLTHTLTVKIPEMIDSHQIMQQFLKSKDQSLEQMIRYLERRSNQDHYKPLIDWLKIRQSTIAPTPITIPRRSDVRIPTTIPSAASSKASFVEGCASRLKGSGRFGFFAAVGAAATMAAYHQWNNSPEDNTRLLTKNWINQ